MNIILPMPNSLHGKSKVIKLTLLALTLLSFFVATWAIWQHNQFQQAALSKTRTELQGLTIKASKDIEAIFRKAMGKVDFIAKNLSSGQLDKSGMLQQIKSLVAENPNYYGSSITYPPYGYDTTKRLYAPYFHRVIGESSKLELAQIEDSYDYTEPDYDWFVRPMKEGRSCFGKPYWDPVGETYMITYSSIFYDPDFNSGNKNSLLYCPILRV